MSDDASSPAAPSREPRVGDYLGHFYLEKKLGEGGMGVVYKAQDTSLGRLVAIKVLSRDRVANEEFVQRFVAEAQAVAKLNHLNIIRVHFIGQQNNVVFFAMEYVEGRALDSILRERKQLDEREAIDYIRQSAEGLRHAHQNGIIHRDIKPANLMLTPFGEVKVTDFGLAKNVGGNHGISITSAPTVMGTPQYMSPEQAQAKRLDHRSDIYSLGATLYHLLAGKPPFEGEDAVATMLMHISDPLKPITIFNPDVTGPVQRIIRRMMAKDVKERYQTYDELLVDINNYLTGPTPTVVRHGAGPQTVPLAPASVLQAMQAAGEAQAAASAAEEAAPSQPIAESEPVAASPPTTRPRIGMSTAAAEPVSEPVTVSVSFDRSTAMWIGGIVVAFIIGFFIGRSTGGGGKKTDAIPPPSQAPAPQGYVQFDLAENFNADVISSPAHLAQDNFGVGEKQFSLVTRSVLMKQGIDEPGLPDDGRLPIPETDPIGYFHLRGAGRNAILLSALGENAANAELPRDKQGRYDRVALLFAPASGEGIFVVTAHYDRGQPQVFELATHESVASEIKGSFMRPASVVRTRLYSHGDATLTSSVEVFSHRIRLESNRKLQAFAFAIKPIRKETSFAPNPGRDKPFAVAILAVSGQPAEVK